MAFPVSMNDLLSKKRKDVNILDICNTKRVLGPMRNHAIFIFMWVVNESRFFMSEIPAHKTRTTHPTNSEQLGQFSWETFIRRCQY